MRRKRQHLLNKPLGRDKEQKISAYSWCLYTELIIFFQTLSSTITMESQGTPSSAFDGPGRIDVHHHCFPGTVKELQSEFEYNSYNLNYTPFPQGPEEHLEYMDEVNIQTAVIVSSPVV